MKIAFQGVPGAYSESAARLLFGPDCETLPCETFEEVFAAVSRGKSFGGALPIENSLAGSIHQNYDLLVRHKLPVVGETYLRVSHALLAPPGVSFAAIRFARSHPQALAQCSAFFAKNPGIKPVPWFDTAGAAESLHNTPPGGGAKTGGIAAIASESAARLYGLKILRRNLQNHAENYTRFLAITKSPPAGAGLKWGVEQKKLPPWGKESGRGGIKTSITFHPRRNASGVLHKILGVFAARGIDLSKIESRPDPKNPFDYRFHLDLIGGVKNSKVAAALKDLRNLVTDFRILGTYPMAKIPPSGGGAKKGGK